VIEAAIAAGRQAKATAERLEAKLTTHKTLEDEAKSLKAAIKSTEAEKNELVEKARLKISKIDARCGCRTGVRCRCVRTARLLKTALRRSRRAICFWV
jgi:hypothetical protein